MIHKALLSFLFFCLLACQPGSPSDIFSEIDALDTDAKKQAYLKQLFEADQHMRRGMDQEILAKFGKDSEEHRQFLADYRANDELNMRKVAYYLSRHGYPKAALGELAVSAPWAVIHHESSDSSVEVRRKYWPYIDQAHQNGDLDDGAVSFYLNRMYRIQFGESHDMQGSFTIDEERNLLLQKMGMRE